MFRPYQIKSKEIESLVSRLDHVTSICYNREYGKFSSTINELLKERFNSQRLVKSLANGSRLQELSFPSGEISHNFDVFISHSHQDEEKKQLITKLASYLYGRYGIRCFVDSEYWAYCNEIIKEVNSEIGKHKEYTLSNGKKLTTSNTSDLLYVASNVYAMLSMAIMRMIDNIPCVIFVDSEESISYIQNANGEIGEITRSPWIYEEINYINSLKEKCPKYYKGQIREGLECFSEGFKFNVDKGNFRTLTAEVLSRLNIDDREQAMCDLFDKYKELPYHNINTVRFL